MIVVDCSALFAFLTSPAEHPQVAEILQSSSGIAAPDFLDVEFAHALRKCERLGRIDAARANMALSDMMSLRVERFPSSDLLLGIWEMRHNFSAYDAAYAVLAQHLNAPLLTVDMRFKRAAVEHFKIVLL